jgi:hypothetical protein
VGAFNDRSRRRRRSTSYRAYQRKIQVMSCQRRASTNWLR